MFGGDPEKKGSIFIPWSLTKKSSFGITVPLIELWISDVPWGLPDLNVFLPSIFKLSITFESPFIASWCFCSINSLSIACESL